MLTRLLPVLLLASLLIWVTFTSELGRADSRADAPLTCSPDHWSPPRELRVAPRRLAYVDRPSFVPTPAGLALLGASAVMEFAADSVRYDSASSAVLGGVLLRRGGGLTAIPKPPGAGVLMHMRGLPDARGLAHVFWGSDSDSAWRTHLAPDTVWYSRFDGGGWSPPEMVYARAGRATRTFWDGSAESAALIGDTTPYAVVPSLDTVYVFSRRRAGHWERVQIPIGASYTALAGDARGNALLAFAPAYFPGGRWDAKAVYVSRWAAGGSRWSDPTPVHRFADRGNAVPSDLQALAGSRDWYLVWTYGLDAMRRDTVYLLASSDRGRSWRTLPPLHIPEGLHSLRAVLDQHGTIWIVGTTGFGRGPLVRARWTGAEWQATAPPPHRVDSSAALVDRPSLGLVPPDSIFVGWMIMRRVKRGFFARAMPGAPITLLSASCIVPY